MSLIELPNEIISLIIIFLDPCDQIKLISTCKHLRKFISYTDIWLHIDFNNYAEILFRLNHNHILYDIKNIVIHNDFNLRLKNNNNYDELILNPINDETKKVNKQKIIDLTRFNKIKKIKYKSTNKDPKMDLYKILLTNISYLKEVLIDGNYSYNVNEIIQMYTHIKFKFIFTEDYIIKLTKAYSYMRWMTGMGNLRFN
jgi:hypothetical protein